MSRSLPRLQWLFVILSFASGCFAEPTPQVPEKWREFVELDQAFNIPDRIEEVFTEEQRKPVPLYHFDIPESECHPRDSEFLDPATRKWVYFEKQGKDGKMQTMIRFFVLDAPGSGFEELKKRYEPQQKYWGARIQGHSSYFVWDPEKPETSPIFMKLRQFVDNGIWNNNSHAQDTIRHNDYVETALKQTPDSTLSFLPERFSAFAGDSDAILTSYSLRSANPLTPAKEGNKIWPLHGFLGSPKFKEMADKAKMTPEEYFQKEYLPKVARFSARTNFVHGFYHASHTQNLIVEINPQTGLIDRFVGKDLYDIMPNPSARIAQGHPTDPLVLYDSTNMNEMYYREGPELPESKNAGTNLGNYTTASLRPDREHPLGDQRARVWLLEYLREAEKILGKPLTLSKENQAVLKALETGGDFVPVIGRERSRIISAVISVTQEIYDKVTAGRLPKITREMKRYPPAALESLFLGQTPDVAFLWRDSAALIKQNLKTKELAYAFDGRHIYAYLKKPEKILAISFDVPEITRNYLKSKMLPKTFLERCRDFFQSLWSS